MSISLSANQLVRAKTPNDSSFHFLSYYTPSLPVFGSEWCLKCVSAAAQDREEPNIDKRGAGGMKRGHFMHMFASVRACMCVCVCREYACAGLQPER